MWMKSSWLRFIGEGMTSDKPIHKRQIMLGEKVIP